MSIKRIEKSFIEELSRYSDLTKLIGSRIEFKKVSGQKSWACCPFHQEKTPSFCVDHQKQFYYCFGCQKSGDALRFLMDYDHLSFVDAVEALAAFNNLEVRYEALSPEREVEIQHEKVRLEKGLEALQAAAEFYHKQLFESSAKHAQLYLRERGLNAPSVRHFFLGYAPKGDVLREFLSANFAEDLLIDCGLLRSRDGRVGDWFYDRIIFPIYNRRGQVIAFGGRALGDAQPKYLNSPESPWFNKRAELYGLYQALEEKPKSLIITEGYMDVVKMGQFGLKNAVAALGTAFGEAHFKAIKQRVNKLYFCFDGDRAGQSAAAKALQIVFSKYEEELECRFMFMPEGEDPDSLLSKEGREAFYRCLDASLTPSKFLQHILQEELGENPSVERQAQVLNSAAHWLGFLPVGGYRELLQKELQNFLHAPVHIESELPSKKQQSRDYKKSYQAALPQKAEWQLMAILLRHPDWCGFSIWQGLSEWAQERYPYFCRLFYLARNGASHILLNEQIRSWQMENDIVQANKRIEHLTEEELKQEFLAAGENLFDSYQIKKQRLEKLGL